MQTKQVTIVGSGPAGYAAAVYLARAQLATLVFAGEKSGGQLMLTTEIENYPGFPKGIMGPQLMMDMRAQAERFGAEIIDKDVRKVDFSKQPFVVDEYQTQAVIIATGAESTLLGVAGESDYIGRGVSYCAVCDAAFFRGKRVFVVGGGDAAMEDTLALLKFARKITVIHRRDSFRASKIMQERVLAKKEIVDVMWNSEVTQVTGNPSAGSGQGKLTGISVKNNVTGNITEYEADGLFVAIGHKPMTGFLRGQLDLDDKGYIKTGLTYPVNVKAQSLNVKTESPWLHGFPTMTSVPGVFAAGDNVDFRYRQASTAAGFGVMAALDAERWLDRK